MAVGGRISREESTTECRDSACHGHRPQDPRLIYSVEAPRHRFLF